MIKSSLRCPTIVALSSLIRSLCDLTTRKLRSKRSEKILRLFHFNLTRHVFNLLFEEEKSVIPNATENHKTQVYTHNILCYDSTNLISELLAALINSVQLHLQLQQRSIQLAY